jgi:predicted small secreted protein
MPLLNDSRRCRLVLSALILCTPALAGCADARGRFEDFQNRLQDGGAGAESADSGSVDQTYDGGACTPPAPGTISGPALLAVDTSLAAGHPILFLGTIDTPELDHTTAVHFVYRALDSLDRSTLVGDELEVGPFPLPDGLLVAQVPESELDGDANPVLHGAPITSEMTLTGHICGVRSFYCGTVEGKSTGLISGAFSGKFGITLLSAPHAIPERPRFGCDAEDFAQPLAD